jgi:DNA-binding transcriptional ArsR family regulator
VPFHMHFGAADLLRCRFAISPLWEAQEAVRTLARPERQGYHLPWLRRIREAAAGLDLEPLWLLMPRRGHNPDFLCPAPVDPVTSMENELRRVRAADPAGARDEMARSLADTPGAADTPKGRAMLADPARAVQELADLYQRVWDALIAPDWPRLRSLLEADIAFHSRRLADDGLEGLFTDLHPRVGWADGILTVASRDSSFTHGRVLDGDGLVLMPGVFVWPEVVSGFDPPWQATLVYPARGIGGLWAGPHAGTSDALLRLLGANRAAVLAGLDAPATTTALAHRHGLALSSVSAHLSVLRDAGLLVSRRYGHQVFYERTPLGTALTGA